MSRGPQQVEWKTPPTRAPCPTSLLYSATAFCVCCTMTSTPCCLTKSRVAEGTWRRRRELCFTEDQHRAALCSGCCHASNTFCVVKNTRCVHPVSFFYLHGLVHASANHHHVDALQQHLLQVSRLHTRVVLTKARPAEKHCTQGTPAALG